MHEWVDGNHTHQFINPVNPQEQIDTVPLYCAQMLI